MVHPARVQSLNAEPVRDGAFVLYWMQASQRADYNPALEYAAARANQLNQPLVVVFGLTEDYPEANLRHYAFMLEGLRQTRDALAERGVQLVVRRQSPEIAAVEMAAEASMLVADAGYTRHQKAWREHVAGEAGRCVVEVEGDVVVPVEVASGKEEYSAATLRPKVQRRLEEYLVPLDRSPVRRDSLGLRLGGEDIGDVEALLGRLKVDRSVPRSRAFVGGASHARRLLAEFVAGKLKYYADVRNDPALGVESHMSPYLHFGQISPVQVALEVKGPNGAMRESKEAYLEELIVRRELSVNFVNHNPRYDSFEALPDWARRTLAAHQDDPRRPEYSLEDLDAARTEDPYWNAAMREMLITGKMHNYMRMYWGKKILEWSPTPQEAFRRTLYLNNRHFLDGRDPCSFGNVAWVFGKHDRPWAERPIFGKVRYMNAAGLERKFDMAGYLRRVEAMQAQQTQECGPPA